MFDNFMNKCYNFATATATPAAGCVYKGVRRKNARQNSKEIIKIFEGGNNNGEQGTESE